MRFSHKKIYLRTQNFLESNNYEKLVRCLKKEYVCSYGFNVENLKERKLFFKKEIEPKSYGLLLSAIG